MSAPNNKPISDVDLYRFRDYREKEPAWGSLHIVLEDQNIEDSHVQWCIDHANKVGDKEGEELGKILLAASKSQRLNLTRRIGKI